MKDIHSDMFVTTVIGAAVLDADNTPTAIDLAGYEAAELILSIGAGGITFDATNKIEFVLTHSDDNVTYTNVTDDDVLGKTGITNGIIKALTAAHASAANYRFGYRGAKRYIKLLADFSGTHGTGTIIGAVAIKSHGHVNPQINQA
jgi:hypothetical protein